MSKKAVVRHALFAVTTVVALSSATLAVASSKVAVGAQAPAPRQNAVLGIVKAPQQAATTTTTTAPPATGPCGGQPTLTANGSTWTCTFDSEFTGTTYNQAQWSPITTATSGYTSGLTACFVNSSNNISVGNGYLSLTARKEAQPFRCTSPFGSFTTQYTSGDLSTYGLFSQAYGRFEVEAKVPSSSVRGLQSSFWLYPQNEKKFGAWPLSGEIDIAETYSEYPGLAIPNIHYVPGPQNAATNTNTTTAFNCVINPNQFNDYVVEWTPGSIRMIYNGTTCLIDNWSPSAPLSGLEPFNQPFFINLTQALGLGTNQFNPATTQLPATTEIKFVRVWQQQPA